MTEAAERVYDMYHSSAVVYDNQLDLIFVNGGIDDETGGCLAYAERVVRALGEYTMHACAYGTNVVSKAGVIINVRSAAL